MKYKIGTLVRYKGELPNFTDIGEIISVDEYDDAIPYHIEFEDGYVIWVAEDEIEEVEL